MTRMSGDQRQVLLVQRNAETDRQQIQSALTSMSEISTVAEHENGESNNTLQSDDVIQQDSPEKHVIEPVALDAKSEAATAVVVVTDTGL